MEETKNLEKSGEKKTYQANLSHFGSRLMKNKFVVHNYNQPYYHTNMFFGKKSRVRARNKMSDLLHLYFFSYDFFFFSLDQIYMVISFFPPRFIYFFPCRFVCSRGKNHCDPLEKKKEL
jgi:hypothetical protein